MKRDCSCLTVLLLATLFAVSATAADPGFRPFSYDYESEAALAARLDVDNPDPAQLRKIFTARRARVLGCQRPPSPSWWYTNTRTPW